MDREVRWIDSVGREWRVGVAKSFKGGYVNLIINKPSRKTGEAIEITNKAFKELRLQICELNTEE